MAAFHIVNKKNLLFYFKKSSLSKTQGHIFILIIFTQTTNVMKVNIGIAEKNLAGTATLLNSLLADEFTLYAKTRNYHWNVTGPNFIEMHKFFEGQYEELDEIMDSVAERVRMLGHFSLGSLNAFSKATRLTEGQDESTTPKMIQSLLDDHETLARETRKDIDTVGDKYKDAGTADFLTGVLKSHEKMAWMLRSHLR